MIRLLLPLVVLTAGIWGIVYAVSGKTRKTSAHYLRQFLFSLVVAASILIVISTFFYFMGGVNAS